MRPTLDHTYRYVTAGSSPHDRSCYSFEYGPIRGLAPREVYRDLEDRSSSGGLLHRLFTLTFSLPRSLMKKRERFVFCDTALSAIIRRLRLIVHLPNLYDAVHKAQFISIGTLPYGVRTFLSYC